MTRTQRPEGTSTDSRIPPHDLEAERSLLGAIMLSREAIAGASNVSPADFYRPIHGAIFDAARDLYLEDVMPDVVTLLDRLGSALTEHGGKGFLLEIMAATPATANATAYAKIVERCARQRAIIATAGEIAAQAYTGTDWHHQAAELQDIAARNGVVFNPSTLEVVDLGPILRGEAPAIVPFWLTRDDGHALLYPGLVHDLHAEPSHGKTWVALLAVTEILRAGGAVVYLDYEDSPDGILGRLIALGTDPALLEHEADRFRYLRPSGPLRDVEVAEIDRIVEELRPDLFIIDGVAEALARDGYSEESNSEVVKWGVRIPRHYADMGPAVLMLDHVKKDPATRTRGARGAGAKLALVNGASFELKLAKPFSRRRSGLVKLILAKDRRGQVGSIGETVAHMRVQPHNDGAEVVLTLELPPPPSEGGFKPTGLMEKVSQHLRTAGIPHTEKLIFAAVPGKREHVRHALALLVAEGFAAEEKVSDGVRYRHVRLYRENAPPLEAVPDPKPEADVPMPDPDLGI